MNENLNRIKTTVYNKLSLTLSDFRIEEESKEYDACLFKLSNRNIISRSANVTPKKIGQFVTFWKRSENGPIEPFHESDLIDFFIVNVKTDTAFGQFIFPKSILIKKGILSTTKKEGKRAFRVYPSWDTAKNKQAIRTQKWQLDYFYMIDDTVDLEKVRLLFGVE